MKRKPILALTGGRFFAMLIIVISHFEFLGQYSIGRFYNTYLHNPTLGVDYFFILSGFGMMLSFIEKDNYPNRIRFQDLIDYALQHIKKIYPLYLSALGLGILYEVATGFVDNGLSFIYSIDSIVIRIIPCIFLLQSATGLQHQTHAFCGVFWFLSCLFCIYLVSLPLLRFFLKHIKTVWMSVVVFLSLTVASVGLVYLFKYIQNYSDFDMLVYASPYRRVFYVACGMVLGIFFNARNNIENRYLEYFAIPLACVYFFLRQHGSAIPYIVYSLDIIICSFALYSLATGKGIFSKVLSSNLFVYLGSLSMYVFISHYLIRMYVNYIVNKLHLQSAAIVLFEIVVIVFGSYGLSIWLQKRACQKTAKNEGDMQNS